MKVLNFSPIHGSNNIFRANFANAGNLSFKGRNLETDVFEKQSPTTKVPISEKDKLRIINLAGKNRLECIELLEGEKKIPLDSVEEFFTDTNKSGFYMLPTRFLKAASDSLIERNDAHIFKKMPKIFKGLDKKAIFKALDDFACLNFKDLTRRIEIDGKTFKIKGIGIGTRGKTYLIEDEKSNQVVLKVYKKERELADSFGFSCEIPTLMALTKRRSKNTPDFYMANAGYFRFEENKVQEDSPWMLDEYIGRDTPLKKGDYALGSWFREKDMCHFDCIQNRLGDYIIDVGGILPKNYFSIYDDKERRKFHLNYTKILNYLKKGYSLDDIINVLKAADV